MAMNITEIFEGLLLRKMTSQFILIDEDANLPQSNGIVQELEDKT